MIKLGALTLENFRGCKHYNMAFGCKAAAIYGANGAGKSTLSDGYTWLLTGKDQQGRAAREQRQAERSRRKDFIDIMEEAK